MRNTQAVVEGSSLLRRRCVLCGAKLAPDNDTGACFCHPRYNPRHDPEFGAWLLRTLLRRAGRVTYPLEQLCKAGRMVVAGRDATDCVHRHVEKLRRAGHVILGERGRSGGYTYICGPKGPVRNPKGHVGNREGHVGTRNGRISGHLKGPQ